MYKVAIKKESLPERCEICHQRDFFDPMKNQCLRCLNFVNIDFSLRINEKKPIQQNVLKRIFWITDLQTAIFTGSLVGILVLSISGYIFNPMFKLVPEVFIGLGFVIGISTGSIFLIIPSIMERIIIALIIFLFLGIGGLFGVVIIAFGAIFSIIFYLAAKKFKH